MRKSNLLKYKYEGTLISVFVFFCFVLFCFRRTAWAVESVRCGRFGNLILDGFFNIFTGFDCFSSIAVVAVESLVVWHTLCYRLLYLNQIMVWLVESEKERKECQVIQN